MTEQTKNTQQVAEHYRWDLDAMYPDPEQIAVDIVDTKKDAEKMAELGANPGENIQEILTLFESSYRRASHLLNYSYMKKSEDTRNQTAQKLDMEANQAFVQLTTAGSFLTPYLLTLSDDEANALLKDEKLAYFHEFLERTFRLKAHTLSEKEEYLLSMFRESREAPGDIYYYLSNADMKFPTIDSLGGEQLKDENFVVLQKNANRDVRKESFEKYYETYNSFANTISTSYYANVKNLTTEAKIRNYESARHMELYTDDVDVKVYDALLESIHSYLPKMHKYYGLKKKALG